MADISFEFAWWEWIALTLVIGWPGLAAGAAIGALAWRKRRIAAAALCGAAGMLIVFFVRVFVL